MLTIPKELLQFKELQSSWSLPLFSVLCDRLLALPFLLIQNKGINSIVNIAYELSLAMNIAFHFETQIVFRKKGVLRRSLQGGAAELKQANTNFLKF